MAKKNKFTELLEGQIELQEAEEGKPRRIRFKEAMTADIINGNGRRYSAPVLEAAVQELRTHLNESAGQGRIVQVLGEAEHPSDKPTGRPNLLETVVKWDEVSFDGRHIDIVGRVLGTSKGQDFLKLMEGGVLPGVSMRGYGDGKNSKTPEGDKVFEVTELHITGFDPVLNPSFQNTAEWVESQNQNDDAEASGENEMSDELLEKLNNEKATLQKQLEEAQKSVAEAEKVKAELEESKRAAQVAKAVEEVIQSLPFGDKLNKMFTEAVQEAKFNSVEEVKAFAESKRKEYGKLAAAGALAGMGFDEKKQSIVMLGDVLENETGTPEFARVAFELTESVRKHEKRYKRTLELRAESPAAVLTEMLLAQFDKTYQRQLLAEARAFQEAETASDLNLPYSVSRAVIAEAYPNLVAANVFDFGIMEQSPMNIFYEAFTGETGFSAAVTDEVETAGAEDTWYDLAHPNIVPGTVVVTSNPAGTTYVEGTDFVIDYELGKIKALTAGDIGANDVLVDYTYHATRQGENTEIERAKTTLSYQTITAAADRLADYITHEAIVFSRSQIGWDAVGRTMANIIRELRRDKDRRLIEKALMAALSVASNKTAAWDIGDAVYLDFVKRIGEAKVKVVNRFYTPTSLIMSATNSDYLSNWDGFTRDGFTNAELNAAGFVGRVKGLNVYETPEMRDPFNLVLDRGILMHRIYQSLLIKGPFPTYSNGKLVAAEQYYAEEYNASLAPIGGKGSVVPTQA